MGTQIERIEYPERDPKFNMPFVPGLVVTSGRLIFCAGTSAAPTYHHHPHRDEDFAEVPDDAEAQARIVMEKIKRTLEAAGASFSDVVQVMRFMTDPENDQDAINRVYGEYFGDHRPTSTTVGVTSLVQSRLRFEMNAIAVVPE
jgi:2-iminobutanoate/2-iminopropanoate deaminase